MSTLRNGALVVGVVASLMTLGSTEAWAQGHGWGRGGGGRVWGRAIKTLDLSQVQVQKIAQARADMIAKVAPIQAQLEVKHMELRQLWQSKSPSRQAIVAKHNEIDALHRQIRDARVGLKLFIFGVLTPEQRATLQKRLEEGPAWRGGKGWGRGGRGGRGKGWGRGGGFGGGPDGPGTVR